MASHLQSYLATAFAFLLVCLFSSTDAVPLDPSSSIVLSVVNTDGSTTTLTATKSSCVQLPSAAASFAAEEANTQITPLFAVYQDATCQTYLYSVESLLKDLNTRAPVPQGVSWIGMDPSQTNRTPGETFVDPSLSTGKETKRSYLVQIVIVSLAGAVVLVGAGLYLCYRDKKDLQQRGFNPQGRPSMAEMSGPGRSVYQYESHHRQGTSGSATSSISYLPPYGLASGAGATHHGEGVTDTKSPHQDPASPTQVSGLGCSVPSSPSQPPPAGFAQDMNYHHQQQPQSPSQKQASDFEEVSSPSTPVPPSSSGVLPLPRPTSTAHMMTTPTTRARSYSNLTNRVGTGVGLDPGSVPQGRNAGFGLGYDLEECEVGEKDRRRDSDMMMMSAAMMDSPPSSPHLRPSSALSMGL
ncbi:hypothetical protein EMPS_08136 [Entomortierella parvispora]|uniref:Mid2 domain-containing protein n=1 Tax=Entomortierella parvispora TaxID=205924 RepID=A0A9P3HFU1_9FUNG|nr:hypothetical protein EMPS_08136 [Entomortierella parvispora]